MPIFQLAVHVRRVTLLSPSACGARIWKRDGPRLRISSSIYELPLASTPSTPSSLNSTPCRYYLFTCNSTKIIKTKTKIRAQRRRRRRRRLDDRIHHISPSEQTWTHFTLFVSSSFSFLASLQIN